MIQDAPYYKWLFNRNIFLSVLLIVLMVALFTVGSIILVRARRQGIQPNSQGNLLVKHNLGHKHIKHDHGIIGDSFHNLRSNTIPK